MIYTEFKTWYEALKYRSRMVFFGSLGFIYFVIIIGAMSIFYYVIRQVNAFFRREIIAGCIISSIMLLMAFGWGYTFVQERYRYSVTQHRADSLSYDLSKLTQMFESSDTIVINGDTIRSW